MPDTPDAYGNRGAIVFEGIANGPVGEWCFRATANSWTAGPFYPINGTIFMGMPGQTVDGPRGNHPGNHRPRARLEEQRCHRWYQF